MQKDLLIPQPLAQAIADYLMGRPYREVAGLLQALGQLKAAESKASADNPHPTETA